MVTIVVEDGNALSTANAYVSETFATTYHGDRGNVAWAALSSEDMKTAIIKATDYIDKRFGRRFRGYKSQKDQALEWPRTSAYSNSSFSYTDADVVPRNLQKACAEYALRTISTSELLPDPSTSSSGSLTRDRQVVGPIETQKDFEGALSRDTASSLISGSNIPEYPAADLWIEELLKPPFGVYLGRGD